MQQRKLLEAALFISEKPMRLDDLAKIIGVNSLGFVKDLLEKMQKEYSESGLEINNTPEGWVMQVKPELLPKIAYLTPYSNMPEGCKRTLALIVYKEPVKQAEIIKIQGNKAYSYIKFLERKGLVKTEKFGHSKILKLTQEFERYFGEEKASVKEMLSLGIKKSEKEIKGELKENIPEISEEESDFEEKTKNEKKPKKETVKAKSDDKSIPASDGELNF